jgi:hypothetical protein
MLIQLNQKKVLSLMKCLLLSNESGIHYQSVMND